VFKPDLRLQCIRKVFGYLSNDLFHVSVKYSLNGSGGNVKYVWINIQFKEGRVVKPVFKMVLVGNRTSMTHDFNDL
jgi:hypothetical protein